MRKTVITGLAALALAVPTVPAHADPHCTEDCGLGQSQGYLQELRRGGIQVDDDQAEEINRAKAICARLNQGATREQVRSVAGDGSDRQTDTVINAAIKFYCPNQTRRV